MGTLQMNWRLDNPLFSSNPLSDTVTAHCNMSLNGVWKPATSCDVSQSPMQLAHSTFAWGNSSVSCAQTFWHGSKQGTGMLQSLLVCEAVHMHCPSSQRPWPEQSFLHALN